MSRFGALANNSLSLMARRKNRSSRQTEISNERTLFDHRRNNPGGPENIHDIPVDILRWEGLQPNPSASHDSGR